MPSPAENAAHEHRWEPCGTAVEEKTIYSPVSVNDHRVAVITLAIRSCGCGAVRKTEVARRYRRLR